MDTIDKGPDSREQPWYCKLVRGSLYAVGPLLDQLGSDLNSFAESEAQACRVARDGDEHHFHITLVHRSQITPLGGPGGNGSTTGESEWASSSTLCARHVALLARASELAAPSSAMPELLCRPIPLYVYETTSGAVAVSVLFLAGELILAEEGLPAVPFHVTLGFNGTDEREARTRRLESVRVLHCCQDGSGLSEIVHQVATLMRKSPTPSRWATRLGELVESLLELVQGGHYVGGALGPAESARVSLVCSLHAFSSGDFGISLTHAEEALAFTKDGATAGPEGQELAVRACRRACVALMALKYYSRAQRFAERGLLISEHDQQLRQFWRRCVDQLLKANAGNTRYRLDVAGVQLPRNFSWVVPWSLGGMSQPMEAEQIDILSRMGVRLVVTIFDIPCIPQDWLDPVPEERRPEVLFLAVPNMHAPSVEQAERFLEAVSRRDEGHDNAVVVHCGGGKGKAGTLLALAMMARRMGQGCKGVIDKLREMRPGSIESSEQEAFLQQWHRTQAAKQYSQSPDAASDRSEPVKLGASEAKPDQPTGTVKGGLSCRLSTEQAGGRQRPAPARIFLLVGLPCSGKSTFARVLHKLTNGKANSISQDDAGSKSAFLSRAHDLMSQGGVVLLDRCNPSAEAREELLTQLGLTAKQVEVIEFRSELEEALRRMLSRRGHPTLHFSSQKASDVERARKVVGSFQSRLSFPSASSGKEGFKAVHTAPSAVPDLPAFLRSLMPKLQGITDEAVLSIVQEDVTAYTTPAVGDDSRASLRKFPRTRHLAAEGSAVGRDDLIVPPELQKAFLNGRNVITVEEKLDGANLGISLDPVTQEIRCQNRSHFVSSESACQFATLDTWLESRRANLYRLLLACPGTELVLYGEWMYARHSITYDRLPDVFVLFDIYDTTARAFFSTERRDQLVRDHTEHGTIFIPPVLARRPLDGMEDLIALMNQQSMYSGEGVMMEGVVLRWEEEGWLKERAKMVRPDFLQVINEGEGHWSKNQLVRNTVRRGGAEEV